MKEHSIVASSTTMALIFGIINYNIFWFMENMYANRHQYKQTSCGRFATSRQYMFIGGMILGTLYHDYKYHRYGLADLMNN